MGIEISEYEFGRKLRAGVNAMRRFVQKLKIIHLIFLHFSVLISPFSNKFSITWFFLFLCYILVVSLTGLMRLMRIIWKHMRFGTVRNFATYICHFQTFLLLYCYIVIIVVVVVLLYNYYSGFDYPDWITATGRNGLKKGLKSYFVVILRELIGGLAVSRCWFVSFVYVAQRLCRPSSHHLCVFVVVIVATSCSRCVRRSYYYLADSMGHVMVAWVWPSVWR